MSPNLPTTVWKKATHLLKLGVLHLLGDGDVRFDRDCGERVVVDGRSR
jgi:hypothetical protein